MTSPKESRAEPSPVQPQRRKGAFPFMPTIVAVCLIFWLWPRAYLPRIPYKHDADDGNASAESFTMWDEIPPSEKLFWVPCFRDQGNFLCARLTVPMDYRRPLNASASHPKVHIAMVMLPGEGHGLESGTFSESPLLFNPGGPGGSGVAVALATNPHLHGVVGRHHDIIGFDPRGIGSTWPQADCFLGQQSSDEPVPIEERNRVAMNRMVWALMGIDAKLANTSSTALSDIYHRAEAIGKLCADQDGEDSIFRYIGTPHVAQDMLSIVDAWDEWRQEAKTKAKPCAGRHQGGLLNKADTDTGLSTRGKLVYWGLSYGTFLGSTFAAMFPDRVGRLILDGVVDSDIYFKNAWLTSLEDTDKVFDDFFSHCHAAKEKCQLFRKGDATGDIRTRFDNVMARLEREPRVIVSRDSRAPTILKLAHIKELVFYSLYFPVTVFPQLAFIVDMLHRDLELAGLVASPDFSVMCSADFKLAMYPEDAAVAIACADWNTLRNLPLSAVQDLFEHLAETSSFADYWMTFLSGCPGWEIEPEQAPGLDWEQFPTQDRPPVNTSYPILFISMTNDPVTPLRQAVTMTQRFQNSGLVEQQSDGHTSLSAVSLCTTERIRAYLNEGSLPEPPVLEGAIAVDQRPKGKWVICKADEKPWRPFGANQGKLLGVDEAYSTAQVATVEAWKAVQQAVRVGMFPNSENPLKKAVMMEYGHLEALFEHQDTERV